MYYQCIAYVGHRTWTYPSLRWKKSGSGLEVNVLVAEFYDEVSPYSAAEIEHGLSQSCMRFINESAIQLTAKKDFQNARKRSMCSEAERPYVIPVS